MLTPDGFVVITDTKGIGVKLLKAKGFDSIHPGKGIFIAAKPRPANIDTWSHPRHGADGNAVSTDTAVGPPRRIRWVAAARHEVEGMVTAGGRNYYGSLLARDSFNGLRLWHYDIGKNKHNSGDFDLLDSPQVSPGRSHRKIHLRHRAIQTRRTRCNHR